MSCTNHPAVIEGVRLCSRCQKPFCPNCLIQFQGQALCGSCKSQRIRAVQSGAPEGSLQLATIGRRWGALWLDSFVVLIPFFIALMLVGALSGLNPDLVGNVANLLLYVGMMTYEALFVSWTGQTLGKKWLGLKVVNPDGSDVTAGQAWGRAASKIFLNLCFAIGYLLALGDKDKRTLHDRLAKTRVIRL